MPANQFMNLEGQKISGSRNWAVWGRDALTRYDPDALRYYLTINMPENHDSDWDWAEFVAKNNGELVATWGNLANRVLAFCYKHWDGHVPRRWIPLHCVPRTWTCWPPSRPGSSLSARNWKPCTCGLRCRKPCDWRARSTNTSTPPPPGSRSRPTRRPPPKRVYTALKAIDSLKVMFAPFLPFTCEKLNGFFGYETPLFGEQYTETVKDSLGEHTVLRYRGRTR